MCGQNSNSHLNSVVKPVCLPIFCCRIFILFAIWHPRSWFKAVCDQKSFIRCWYRTRFTKQSSDVDSFGLVFAGIYCFAIPAGATRGRMATSLPASIHSSIHSSVLSCIPPLTIHQFIPLSIHPYPCMNACTDIVYRCPCFPLCYGWRVGIVYPKCHC